VRARICCVSLSALFVVVAAAQTVHEPALPPYIGAGVGSPDFSDAFSFAGNQALLCYTPHSRLGAFSEKKFMLEETAMHGLFFSLPVWNGGAGLQFRYTGFADFNQSMLGLAYAKKLGNLVGIGLQFDYHMIHIAGYGSSAAIGTGAALLVQPSNNLYIGFQVANPVGGRFRKNNGERLATVVKTSIGYEASQQVLIVLDIDKEEDRPVEILATLRYVFARRFFATIGISGSSGSPFAGIGLQWKQFRFDFSTRFHPQLGFSPAVSLMAEFGKKNLQNQ